MTRRLMERPVQNSIDSDVQRPTAFTIGRRLAALSLAALLGGCHQSQGPAPLPVAVVSVAVQASPSGEAGAPLRYPIEVAARYSNGMSFRIAGQLIERRVRLGDAVRKGEVLARLDSVDAEKQAAIARAALQAAESRLTFAKQQIERDRTQASQELIAQSQLEQTQDAYSAALAARAQAVDQLALALNTLRYNSLIAEHNGIITSENADTGQVVAAGQAVYGLAWSGDVDITLDAAAIDLANISSGQTAVVTFLALPGREFAGQVREIAPAADPQSRTYRVKLTLLDGGTEVRLGMTGDAALAPPARAAAVANAPTFMIPATAIFHRGRNPAVWIIKPHDSTLELRPVTISSYSERSATIKGGLAEGETVVLAGVHTVYEGERATAVKPLFTDDDAAGTMAAANSP
jgi:membrane fusion protein, multidrug efflux system